MTTTNFSRREFIKKAGTAVAASAVAGPVFAKDETDTTPGAGHMDIGKHIYKSLKWDMVRHRGSTLEKFKLLKELGYDGVELNSPDDLNKREALEASKATGLPIEGIVNAKHWNVRHSDPDPGVRARALENMKTALRDAGLVGADSVLLVPGKVTDPERENHDQVWTRSIAEIRKLLPLAAELKVKILIENVGNGFCYDPKKLAAYVDEIDSPWVGVHFDIGNHIWHSPPAEWIRVLGKRIHKLDVKDRKRDRKRSRIGDGDADWPEVRKALVELGYRGWAAAEVPGGDRDRLAEILDRMNRVLGKSDGNPSALKTASARSRTRHFRMGFTGFPHDISMDAVLDARRFSRENADILAHHIEGVPWAEALHEEPFSKELVEEWSGKKEATPDGGKIYLAVSPGRGDLKVADKGLPLPEELQGKPYDHPLVKKAFLNYCRRAIDFFEPDYLGIGIEVNEIYQASPEKWRAYARLHRYVYGELKKRHAGLPIFASFTLHGMLNARGVARERMVAAFDEIEPQNDLVAVSFYPFVAGGTTKIGAALKWMTDHFDRYEKPYAVAETGEAADRLTFPSTGQVVDGTPEKQTAYYRELLATARTGHFEFVISFLHRDYDAMWEKIKSGVPEFFMAWRDCGLVDEAGKPRPAYQVWKRYFDMPLAGR